MSAARAPAGAGIGLRHAHYDAFMTAPPAVDWIEVHSENYFGDVAQLEWALHVAGFAADVVPLTPRQWTELGAGRLATARLAVHPACAALASRYAAEAIWRAHLRGAEDAWPERIDTPSWTLVVRPQWRPAPLTQSEAAHVAFLAIQHGRTLDEALDEGFAVDSGFDFARQWRVWIESGAITGLRAGLRAGLRDD